jgi:hypothetical protein
LRQAFFDPAFPFGLGVEQYPHEDVIWRERNGAFSFI